MSRVGRQTGSRAATSLARLAAILLTVPLLAGADWNQENLTFGLRSSILLFAALAPSHPQTIYLTARDGHVFSTHSRGTAWEEALLIAQAEPFYGAIRAGSAPSGVSLDTQETLAAPLAASEAQRSAAGLFYYDYGELEEEFDALESGIHFKAFDPVWLPSFPDAGELPLRDESVGGDGAGGGNWLGIGLKGGAPRLKAELRRQELPSVGMNLQQLLVEMGTEPTSVNSVDVHPRNHRVALAATAMGTFRTTDGGIGWLPLFAGTDRRQQDAQHVRFDPTNPDRIFLGTQGGLFISTNGGERFDGLAGTPVDGEFVTWIEPVPRPDGKLWLYLGSANGAFLSRDGGRSWRWIFYESLPDANWVTSVAVAADDPAVALLSTWDGLYLTTDEGNSWEQAGGLMFSGQYLPRVLFDPADSRHAVACTEENIWESHDRGRTWSVIYLGHGDWKMRNLAWDPGEPGVLWALTSGQLLRLSRKSQSPSRGAQVRSFRHRLASEPSLAQAQSRALDHLGLAPERAAALGERGRFAPLLPELYALGGHMAGSLNGHLDLVPLLVASGGGDHALARQEGFETSYLAVMAGWDLAPLIFDVGDLPAGRVYDEVAEQGRELKFELVRYFEERQRLLYRLMVEPPADLPQRVEMSLRYRELTEHLDALTGGLYRPLLVELARGEATWFEDYR